MGGVPRLLGREAEERQLGALLTAARNGRGGSLLVLGEPGIGKSALLRATADRGMRQLRVTGYEAESTIPYAALYRLMLPLRPHLASLSDFHQRALRVAAALEPGPPRPLPRRDGGARAPGGGERVDPAGLHGRRRAPPRRQSLRP